jgi:hypothetical protein
VRYCREKPLEAAPPFSEKAAIHTSRSIGLFGLFGSISCGRHERLQCARGSFNQPVQKKGNRDPTAPLSVQIV